MREKRRPSLEELRALPPEMWELEIHQILVDWPRKEAGKAPDWLLDSRLFDDLTPEKVIQARERARQEIALHCGTGSTEQPTKPPERAEGN